MNPSMTDELPELMRAAVLTPEQQIILEQRRRPDPGPGDVLVRVRSVGVCGSDVHYFRQGRIGEFVVEAPLVLGHEAAGEIAAVGAGVDPERIGQRVSIEPQRPRLDSPQSLAGQYHLDPDIEFYATPPVDGAFAEYVLIPAHFAHPVPQELSDDTAALLEPLSVGIAALRKAALTVGERVLITGAGPIGLILVQLARVYGAQRIAVTDLDPQRLALASEFGATETHDAGAGTVAEEPGFEVFLDASGAGSAVRSGLRCLAPAGRAVLIGMGAEEYALPVAVIQNRELTVQGVFRYANTWPVAIDLVARGLVDLDALVTERFGLADTQKALETAGDAAVLKNMVLPDQ